jgi:hypothetical protein
MVRLVIAKAANLMSGQALAVVKVTNKVAASCVKAEKQAKENKEVRKFMVKMVMDMCKPESEEGVTE